MRIALLMGLALFAGMTLAAAVPLAGPSNDVLREKRDDGARGRHAEPVAFADNFMRTADEPGPWHIQRGNWRLQSAWDTDPKGNQRRFENAIYGQNPFAWAGRATAGASALCTAGQPAWEEYLFTTALQPGATGAAGVMVNMPDGVHGYLVRWSPANAHRAGDDCLALYRVNGAQRTLIAATHGGYVPEQWYKLTVISSQHGLQVLVDGRRRLSTGIASPWRGGVGLYTEGAAGTVFNNVTVYGLTLNTDLLREQQQQHIQQRFRDDPNEIKEWAARSNWAPFPGKPSQLCYRCAVYGEPWMTLTVRPFRSDTGELMLGLNGDGHDPASGFRAVVAQTNGHLTLTLYRGATALISKTAALLDTTAEYTFRFRLAGASLRLERDGEIVLEAKNISPLTTHYPSFHAMGSYALAHDVTVYSKNMQLYSFAEAPVDWLEQGTWMETTRWSCSPQWSFLAGWSRGEAVLWYKKCLVGDQSLEAFVGPKMEYPRQRANYVDRYRDFAISLCSDGRDPRSGYAGIYGAPDKTGTRTNQRTILLRNGVEVASADVHLPPDNVAHQRWFDVELRKQGDLIALWISGEPIIRYRDPHPLDGGVPAIWTMDNGMSIAYAQLNFAQPVRERATAQVVLEAPWYPVWTNLHGPLTLNLHAAWATSGKPIALKVRTRLAPGGDERAVTVAGQQIRYTPTRTGEHWYEIIASDGVVQSSFHLFGPTFDPALHRDDRHAVLLYRFDEGNGNTVHDHGAIGPPADLCILKHGANDTAPNWLPTQGLTIRAENLLRSQGNVPKLMAIAKANACTLEFWIAPDTCFPATQQCGALLAWKSKTDPHHGANFLVEHDTNTLAFQPLHTQPQPQEYTMTAEIFRTGLHHYVLTWDGHTTRWYCNGQPVAASDHVNWNCQQWLADTPLLLGNDEQLQRNFLGSYYLLALHDRCLPAAEVLHNYLAGPSSNSEE